MTTPADRRRTSGDAELAEPPWSILTFPFLPGPRGRVRFEALCALLRSRGISSVDMFAFEIRLHGEARVRRALRANGLTLSTLIIGVQFLAPSDRIEKKLQKSVELADRLGSKRLMIVPMDALTARRQLRLVTPEVRLEHHVRGFTLAVELATRHGIEVLVEDTPTVDTRLASVADCEALLERVPGLGLVYDTGNMIVAGDDPLEFYDRVGDRVRYSHFKDVMLHDRLRGDRTIDGRHMSPMVWGAGIVPLPEIFTRLRAEGYSHPIAIEYVAPTGRTDLAGHTAQLDRFIAAAQRLRDPASDSRPDDSTRPFRWAYIGTGSIARTTARSILRTGRHQIATTYSRTHAKNAAFAKRVNATASATLEDAILDPSVDAVYIATPASSHAALARQCIELRKPVLVEKPFTVNAGQAEAVVAAARASEVYLAEAMWTWFSPVARRVKAWIDDGELGDVLDVTITIGFDLRRFFPRLMDPELAGGGLLDLGIYATTYAHRLFGMPDEIRAVGTVEGGVDTEVELELVYRDGPTVRIRNSITRWLGERIVIRGTSGRIDLPFFHAARAVTLVPARGRRRRFRASGGYANQFDQVANEIRAGRTESALVPPMATIENLQLLDECRRQIGLRYPFEQGTRLDPASPR